MQLMKNGRQLRSLLSIIVLLASMMISLTCTVETGAKTYERYVNADFLTVRQSNSASSKALGAFDYGEKITCYGEKGNWVMVKIDGLNGYVYNGYLQTTKPGAVAATTDNSYTRYVIADNLNIRKSTSTSAKKLGSYQYGEKITCYGTDGSWTKVLYAGKTAYVYTTYLSKTSPTENAIASTAKPQNNVATYVMYVDCSDLNVREEATSKSAILAVYYRGDAVTCYGTKGDWTKVKCDDGYGYMFTSYLSAKKQNEIYSGSSSSVSGSLVASYAKKFVGLRYIWGGASLSKGVDCSGFTQQIYKHFGYSLPHSALSQRSSGYSVSANNRKPGDLICYDKKNGNYHVGVYIGNNQVVHASSAKTGVKISTWNYRSVNCVRRLVK